MKEKVSIREGGMKRDDIDRSRRFAEKLVAMSLNKIIKILSSIFQFVEYKIIYQYKMSVSQFKNYSVVI